MGKYQQFYNRSIDHPDQFWTEQAARIDWVKPFSKVCDFSKPPFAKWFVDGETNLCYNAIDRHLATRADQNAMVWISSEVEQTRTYTYRDMFNEVNRFAAVLKILGVGKGDRVLIYMPMIPEAVFAMLATVRIGAIHSVVFGGFAAASLAARIDDAQPKVMVTADAGSRMGKIIPLKPLTDESIKLSQHPPKHVVIVNRGLDKGMSTIPGRDMDYSVLRNKHLNDVVPCEWVESSHPSIQRPRDLRREPRRTSGQRGLACAEPPRRARHHERRTPCSLAVGWPRVERARSPGRESCRGGRERRGSLRAPHRRLRSRSRQLPVVARRRAAERRSQPDVEQPGREPKGDASRPLLAGQPLGSRRHRAGRQATGPPRAGRRKRLVEL